MLLTIRSFLPLLLVILQFFAPLLHAHAGRQNPHFGLHIPGLEAYMTASSTGFAVQTEPHYTAAENCIVAVNDGIRENPPSPTEAPSPDDCLPLWSLIFSANTESTLSVEFPEPPLLLSKPRSPALPPRAPPVI
jgi:hypothetical protein